LSAVNDVIIATSHVENYDDGDGGGGDKKAATDQATTETKTPRQ
jgi:hypothetical protein